MLINSSAPPISLVIESLDTLNVSNNYFDKAAISCIKSSMNNCSHLIYENINNLFKV